MIRFLMCSLVIFLAIHIYDGLSQCFDCSKAPFGTIFCDDFEDSLNLNQKYFEYDNNNGDFIMLKNSGRDNSNGMRVKWQKGEISAGSLKKSFGRIEGSYLNKNNKFQKIDYNEIYWRIDVKSQNGWTGGGPAKLTRALTMANQNWATGMMAHLWSGGKNDMYLGMDPASGIALDGTLKSTKYNDFENLRWLGFKSGLTDIYRTENSDKWYCIEGHVKLNESGKTDGIFEFWINDTLQAGSYNLNWHSIWNNNPNNYKINAIFFENYWNSGSPVEQERYFDNIVISTNRIGCKCQETTVLGEKEHPEISFQPNPADDYLFIKFPNSIIPQSITIFDYSGIKIIEESYPSNQINIDINNWNSGLYLVIVKDISNHFYQFKFIKKD